MTHMKQRSRSVFVLVSLLLVSLAACRDEEKAGPLGLRIAPDFSLADANPNSRTTGQSVSPRQELRNISAWYFGHAN